MKSIRLVSIVLAINSLIFAAAYLLHLYSLNSTSYLLRVTTAETRAESMRLRYEISVVPDLCVDWDGDIYVKLEADKERWVLAHVSRIKEEGTPYLKGRIENGQILYGIEDYPIRKDATIPVGVITVRIGIDPSSDQARIKQLLVNDQPWVP
jgi:uncharacterized membrane-anchored protein